MGESAAADGDASEGAPSGDKVDIVNVSEAGDLVLHVKFETSRDTLAKSRKAANAAARKNGQHKTNGSESQSFKPVVNVAYRVDLDTLQKQSVYFSNLLSNPKFKEAKTISDAHAVLKSQGVKVAEAKPEDLPWIRITDDDEATKAAGRERAFEDILRIIHQKPPKATKITMSYVTTLAIIADRFDCASGVSRSLTTDLKFKWPLTNTRPLRDETGKPTEIEQVLRQKILAAWLLNQPLRLAASTRELIVRGSRLWTNYPSEDDTSHTAAWWNLPDGLEEELQYRRECIMTTIASIQSHFLALYSSRERQCKLGYDSSPACDSFQLGQMLKFLLSRNLLYFVDFSPASIDALPDHFSTLDLDADLLAVLKQCPNYQVDKFHTNCGLRIRIDPILDYVRAMLSANVVAISLPAWKKDREQTSWMPAVQDGTADGDRPRKFAFTRAMSNDQRLRYEGAIYADNMARALFTADSWDWTPEY